MSPTLESQKPQWQQFEEVDVEGVFGDEAMRFGDDMGLYEGGSNDYADRLEQERGCECAAGFGVDEACVGECKAAEEEAGY